MAFISNIVRAIWGKKPLPPPSTAVDFFTKWDYQEEEKPPQTLDQMKEAMQRIAQAFSIGKKSTKPKRKRV